ncbi:hypothetical protein NC651_038002 [Populus alba x Populus x berolinensis]|nr:hypothetical protein NC651_038002 [Populus alba x Populus x berolinensis]
MAVEDHRQNMLVWFDLLVYFGDRRAVVKSGCGVGTSYNIVECPEFGCDVIIIRFLDYCLRDVESCMPYCLPLFEYMVIFIDTGTQQNEFTSFCGSWIMFCSHIPKKKTTTKTTQGWSTISAVKSGGIRQASKKSHLCIVCCFDVHKARY